MITLRLRSSAREYLGFFLHVSIFTSTFTVIVVSRNDCSCAWMNPVRAWYNSIEKDIAR